MSPTPTRLRSPLTAVAVAGLLLATVAQAPIAQAETPPIPTPHITQGDLLVANHSFEDGLEHWTATNGRGGPASKQCADAIGTGTAGATDLASAAQFRGAPPCVNTGLLSAPLGGIVAGDAYTAFTDASGAGTVSLGFRWLDDRGAVVETAYSDRLDAASRMEFTATAPEGATQVAVEIGAHKSVTVDDVRITAPYTNVGAQITRRGSFLAQYAGYDENGRAVMFSVATGNAHQAAVLVVTDILTKQVTATIDLVGATGSWTVNQADDGTVYVGTYQSAHLYAWTPGEPEARLIGGLPLEGNGFVYSVSTAPDGTVYGGAWGEPANGYEGAQLWKYHPDNGFSKFGETLTTRAFYTTAVGYDDVSNTVWAGTGTVSGLYGCTVEDEQCTDYSNLLGDAILSKPWVYTMRAGGGYVVAWGGDVASAGRDALVVLKVGRDTDKAMTVEKVAEINGPIYPGGSEVVDGKVWYGRATAGYPLYSYDLATGVETVHDDARTGMLPRAWDVIDLRDPDWPGPSVLGWNSGGVLVAYNIATGKLTSTTVQGIPQMSTGLNAVSDGPDGRMWSSGYLTGALGVVTPMRGDRQATYVVGGQSEFMTQHRDRVYQGIYPYGQVQSFAPAEVTAGRAPRVDCTIGHEQNRPYALLGKDDRMYFGSQATNAATKGAFGWLDLTTGQCTTFSEEVGHYSINALATSGGKVFGGSNIYYSWDGLPFEEEAYLLVYDEGTDAIDRMGLPVDGLRSVNALATDARGTVWAYAEGWLLGLDPDTLEWIHVEEIFPDWKPPQRIAGSYAGMVTHLDGRIYGFAAGRVFTFDPAATRDAGSAGSSLQILYQGSALWVKIDEYGNIWTIHNQTQLMRINPRAAVA